MRSRDKMTNFALVIGESVEADFQSRKQGHGLWY